MTPDDFNTILIVIGVAFVGVIIIAFVIYNRKITSLKAEIPTLAREQYEQWRQRDYNAMVSQQTDVAQREAQSQLAQWRVENEASIRQDAITRSRAVIVGKVIEHLVPYNPLIFPYNPKDARFIGSPIDMIVFDGCDEGEIREVVFLEIKSGTSGLSTRQRQIRDAVEAGRVVWRVLKG